MPFSSHSQPDVFSLFMHGKVQLYLIKTLLPSINLIPEGVEGIERPIRRPTGLFQLFSIKLRAMHQTLKSLTKTCNRQLINAAINI
jgi:hypothetical protein